MMPGAGNRPFVPAIDLDRLLKAAVVLNFAAVDVGTSGTLVWYVVKIPFFSNDFARLSLKIIWAIDTDADNAESVVFPDAFTGGSAPVLVPIRHTGGGTTFGFNNLTASGFDYDLPGSNNTLSWVAIGVDSVS